MVNNMTNTILRAEGGCSVHETATASGFPKIWQMAPPLSPVLLMFINFSYYTRWCQLKGNINVSNNTIYHSSAVSNFK